MGVAGVDFKQGEIDNMEDCNKCKKEIEYSKREKLKREKPLVFEKILKLEERFKAGLATPVVDIGYNLACNFKCKHCFISKFTRKARVLTPADLKKFSDEAHELGLCQLVLSGGEPLILKDLKDVIAALQPNKFHLSMSTNGYFLTKEMAAKLKSWGLDKVKISIDDFDEKLHDRNRDQEGAYTKAMDALFNARDAGLNVVIQTCISHQNCRTDRTAQMAKFAQEHDFVVDPIGEWEAKHEVLIDEEDAAYLREVNKQYPALHRDTFPTYGINRGCGCVNSNLHLTQCGEILPCGFLPISLGSIFEESLEEILKRGMSIKHFKEYNPLCISGEDRNFINKYLTKCYGKPLPVPWFEVFTEEDFVK